MAVIVISSKLLHCAVTYDFLITGCFNDNKDDQSHNIDSGSSCTKKDSSYECQKSCEETSGCKRFVYIRDTYNGVYGTGIRKCCFLKDQDVPNYKKVQDLVSGPAKCPVAPSASGELNRVDICVCVYVCVCTRVIV